MNQQDVQQRLVEQACIGSVVSWCKKHAVCNRHLLRYLIAKDVSGDCFGIVRPDFIKYGFDFNNKPVVIGIEHFACSNEVVISENVVSFIYPGLDSDMRVLRDLYRNDAKSLTDEEFNKRIVSDGLFSDIIENIIAKRICCNYFSFMDSFEYSLSKHLRDKRGNDKISIYRKNVNDVIRHFGFSGRSVFGFLIDVPFDVVNFVTLCNKKKVQNPEFFMTDWMLSRLQNIAMTTDVDFIVFRWRHAYSAQRNHDNMRILLLDMHKDLKHQCERQGMSIFKAAFSVTPFQMMAYMRNFKFSICFTGDDEQKLLQTMTCKNAHLVKSDRIFDLEWQATAKAYAALLNGDACVTDLDTYFYCKNALQIFRAQQIKQKYLMNYGLTVLHNTHRLYVQGFKKKAEQTTYSELIYKEDEKS